MLFTDHEYVIITKIVKNNKIYTEKYTGKCQGSYVGEINWLFFDVARVKTPYDVKLLRIFTKWDEYFDLSGMKTLIENSKKARETMENRALNIILKRLVNEEFQW
jgi:hypothetical protein